MEDGTAKDDWTPFNLEFKWKEGAAYDATKTYKLASYVLQVRMVLISMVRLIVL